MANKKVCNDCKEQKIILPNHNKNRPELTGLCFGCIGIRLGFFEKGPNYSKNSKRIKK